MVSTARVTTFSSQSPIRQLHTAQVSMPHALPNPNIVETLPSPDGRQIAWIVGYGDSSATLPPTEKLPDEPRPEKGSEFWSDYAPDSLHLLPYNRPLSAAERSAFRVIAEFRPEPIFGPITRDTKLRAYSLLVSRTDGTGMHEVGTWLEEIDYTVSLTVDDLRWLPNGRQLSFFCKDKLYTVPVD